MSELSASRLRALLPARGFVRDLHLREAAESTNDVALELARAGAEQGTVVLAGSQSRGRGRRGRSWHSPPGLGLYVSVLFRPRRAPAELTRWTLAGAVALCEVCRGIPGVEAWIDWPNDLVAGERKLAGVLAEARSGPEGSQLVLGAGLNVSHREADFPPELRGSATSLLLLAPASPVEREWLAAGFLRRLGELAAELDAGRFAAIGARYVELAPGTRDRAVEVRTEPEAGAWEGITRGIDDCGSLRVEDPAGRIRLVRLADAVRPTAG